MMTTETQNQINNGDTVIYRENYGTKPVYAVVNRVTKKQFYIILADSMEKGPYYREASGWEDTQSFQIVTRHGRSNVHLSTDENFQRLMNEHVEHQKRQAEKKAKQEERAESIRLRNEQELSEVKVAVEAAGGINTCLYAKEIMPDGSRLYMVNLPCRNEKKTWERLWIKCQKPTYSLREDEEVEMSYTYANNNSSSFSSVSTSRHKTDEDAIWNACKSQYFYN